MEVRNFKSLDQIPKGSFEGYLWSSDSQFPEVLNNAEADFSKYMRQNPFLIEGLLYDRQQQLSIHIQHVGEYVISAYTIKSLSPDFVTVEKVYLPHRLQGVKNVCFKQIWQPTADPLCNGMEVQQLAAVVFCGFKKNEQ